MLDPALFLQALVVLTLAWVLAQVAKVLRLPPLLGMLAAGVLAGNLLLVNLPHPTGLELGEVGSTARMMALAVVLVRAGLGIAASDVRRAGRLAVSLGVIPMLCDAVFVAVAAYLLLDLPLTVCAVMGFLVAAISPAIVIPGMLEITESRRGTARNVPTALLAGAPLDNIVALVGLGVALDVALSTGESWLWTVVSVPYSVGIGAAMGIAAGFFTAVAYSRLSPLESKSCRAFTAKLTRLAPGLVWLIGCALLPLSAIIDVSPVIAILAYGAILRERLPADAVTKLSVGLSQIWSVVQYVLFASIGFALDLEPLATVGLAACAIILLGQVGRTIGTFAATAQTSLRFRERLACVLAYMPKATIQAAFAAVPLERGLVGGETVLSVGVLAVVIMAPLGVMTLHRGAEALLPSGPRESCSH